MRKITFGAEEENRFLRQPTWPIFPASIADHLAHFCWPQSRTTSRLSTTKIDDWTTFWSEKKTRFQDRRPHSFFPAFIAADLKAKQTEDFEAVFRLTSRPLVGLLGLVGLLVGLLWDLRTHHQSISIVMVIIWCDQPFISSPGPQRKVKKRNNIERKHFLILQWKIKQNHMYSFCSNSHISAQEGVRAFLTADSESPLPRLKPAYK